MDIRNQPVLVTGGASGLGAETARELARAGARVAVLDTNLDLAREVAGQIGGIAVECDVASAESAGRAVEHVRSALGAARVLAHCAGIGGARRVVGKDGAPAPLDEFERIVRVNLVGTYNMMRLAAADMVAAAPLGDDGERGVMVATASVAAWDGQVGQQAYSASKGGIAALTLPMARDLAQFGVRVMTVAPGLFMTPLLHKLPAEVQASLGASIPFPKRLGSPAEFAALVAHIVANASLNGETIRLDGALRLPPR